MVQHGQPPVPRILNKGQTDYDELADLRLEGPWDEVLMAAWKGWTYDSIHLGKPFRHPKTLQHNMRPSTAWSTNGHFVSAISRLHF